MTIHRLFPSGAWQVSGIINGRLVTRTYYGYSKHDAIKLFNREKGASMKRCNEKAVWYSAVNGYRACREHTEDGMLLCAEAGPEPFGRCDKPIETTGAILGAPS